MNLLSSLRRKYAFTLIELLVVIAIIGILAAILIPALGKVKAASHNAACVSNMRQLGTALLLYCSDNNQRLPGPLFSDQGPVYNKDHRRLPNHLAPYLDIDESDTWTTTISDMTRAEIFACPAWYAEAQEEDIYSLQLNQWVPLPDGGTINPWGSGDSKGNGDINDMNPPPITLLQIYAKDIHPSDSWLIVESDLQREHATSARLLDAPVHGNHRNAIFLDGHVGALDLDDNPL